MIRIYLTVQMGFCGVCYLSINQTEVRIAVGTINKFKTKPFPADTLLQPNMVWDFWYVASAPLFRLFFFLIEEVEVAAQRLCLQNTWVSTGSSGVWELTESSCPPQSFLPLLICGFQPCHSAF